MSPDQTVSNTVVPIQKWPLPWAQTAQEWLGDVSLQLPSRFARSPSQVTKPDLLGIVASHRHRTEPLRPGWEACLEVALKYAERGRIVILFAGGSPYSERLRHACNRFRLDYLELWHENDRRVRMDPIHAAVIQVQGNPLPPRSVVPEARFEDRAVTILADQLFALQVRANGKVSRLVEARLAEEGIRPGSTFVACNAKANSAKHLRLERSMSALGAVLWFAERNELVSRAGERRRLANWGCRNRGLPSTNMPRAKIPPSLLQSREYLIHCTRRRQTAWPDQSNEHLYDEAIRLDWHEDSHEMDTLLRILNTQRLIASSNLRRGKVRTVCFTARSLDQTLSHRSFQSHLGRWDWEPYGIAIRKDRLIALGAGPVQYLPSEVIDTLPELEQALAQPSSMHPSQTDWSVEEEWRVPGDIRLCHLGPNDAFLFVRTEQDAISLSPWSRWPIYHLRLCA